VTALERLLEALLFAAGSPLPEAELARRMGLTVLELRSLVERYRANVDGRGFALVETEAGLGLVPAPDLQATVAERLGQRPEPLSAAALEVLAIVARHQPVDRATIEEIRGVRSERSLQLLAEEGLIAEAGRGEGPGRPILWRTTPEFLVRFRLTSLADLPAWPEEGA
jgi:segregation and condensation protein B